MAVGDRLRSPDALGYAAYEVTDEAVANGEKQVAMLVKAVGDDGSTSALATATKQDEQSVLLGAVNETAPATDTASSGHSGRLQRIAQRITSLIVLLPTSLGQKTKANSFPVVIASDQDPLSTTVKQATAATLASVTSNASSVTIFASNANARGRLVFNDADKALSLKFGATASATSFTVQIAAGGYYEFPQPIYTGVADGIWAAGPTGSARVTELT